jgi:hypothetical protein
VPLLGQGDAALHPVSIPHDKSAEWLRIEQFI